MLGGSMQDSASGGSISAHDATNWQMIKTALETAKQRRSGHQLHAALV